MKTLKQIGEFVFHSKKKKVIKKLLTQAGYSEIPYGQLATLFFVTIAMAIISLIIFIFKSGITSLHIALIIPLSLLLLVGFETIIVILAYFILKIYITTRIFGRMQNIEKHLPLFLREFSTNLKAGREFVDALEDSLTSELGVLNDDVAHMIIEIRAGKLTEEVVKEYSLRYDSYAINETFGIVLDSYAEGGGLAEILDRVAYNLETINFLKKSAVASVYNYIIFMSIVSLLITPILFALSYNVLVLIQSLLTRVARSGSTYLPSFISPLEINFSHFTTFSWICVGVISGSAAAIIALIKKGTLRGSVVLILTYMLIAIGIYQLFFYILQHLFTILFSI